MSKNFQLLRRVEKVDIFTVPGEPAQPQIETSAAILFKKATHDAEIAKLVQRLFSQASKGSIGPRVVSFSGIANEDRSSWICRRVGETLVEHADTTVCIVETNLRSPRLHIHASVNHRHGLAEALTSTAPIRSFAMPQSRENLWVIPAGLGRPGVYSSTERYRERFAELREAFDYILISAPALSRETEATLIGQVADGVVLVVEANHTRRETVRRAKEQLESANVRLLGAVLDQRTFPIPERIYKRL
jgi:Mrp family chromosome partitioning ATPase